MTDHLGQNEATDLRSAAKAVLDSAVETFNGAVEVSEESLAALEAALWACVNCGATTGRYDNGDACERCVLDSFAEGG